MTIEEFLFHKVSGRRSRTECLHDILIVAKGGLKRTVIMEAARLSWIPMNKLLNVAEAAGLIEAVEVVRRGLRGRTGAAGWKTTDKGLKYAKGVYDNWKLLQEVG